MQGNVVYASLKEAIDALRNDAQRLDDPIDNFIQQAQTIGADGASAWSGTAASQVVPTLMNIKADIITIQEACEEFATKAQNAASNYARADVIGTSAVNNITE